MSNKMRKRLIPLTAVLATGTLLLVGCSSGGNAGPSASGAAGGGTVKLSFLTGSDDQVRIPSQALADAFMAKNPDVKITLETQPGGTEGDNLIKTRLATGDMNDVFLYNSGSLLQALNPQQNLIPLTDRPWIKDTMQGFLDSTKSGNDQYGAPVGSAGTGGVLYNVGVYDKLGLKAPTTWDEFMANNQKIKAAGIAPVEMTYGDSWTSQIVLLADFHNILAKDPKWASDYTANKAKYVDQPALRSFEKIADLHSAGAVNADFASAKLADGLTAVATGTAAQYPMLSIAIGQMTHDIPDSAQGVGFFPIPGDDASTNGFTVWMGNAIYVPKTTTGAKLDAVNRFLEFIASPAGCDAQTAKSAPTGPYMVQGCKLPDNLPLAIKQMLPFFSKSTGTSPALEFLSPVKGPSLEQICVEVGSGITSAAAGAKLYDEDVKKQAQQLGLAGW
jgi:raffinose/stachyose/melibiose transport system substrate-binding protein